MSGRFAHAVGAFLTSAILAAAPAAQEVAPASVRVPLLRLRTLGPGALAEAFAGTALAQAPRQAELVEAWEMLVAKTTAQTTGTSEPEPDSIASFWRALDGFAGSLEFQLHGAPDGPGESFSQYACFARFEGVDAVPGLGERLETWLREASDPEVLRGITRNGGNLEAEWGKGEPVEPAPWLSSGESPFYLEADLAPWLSALAQVPVETGAGFDELLDHFGMLSLGVASFSLTPRGAAVEMRLAAAVDGTQGIWPALRRPPGAGDRPLAFVPPGMDVSWGVEVLDPVALTKLAERANLLPSEVAQAEKEGRGSVDPQHEEAMQHLTDILGGVSPAQLLESVGREWLFLSSGELFETAGGPPRWVESGSGAAIALELADRDLVASTLERVIRRNGLHAARRSRDHNGQSVHSMIVGGMFQVHYAISDTHLWAGFGDGGLDLIRAGLDGFAAGPKELDALDPATARHLRALGRDWDQINSYSVLRILQAVREQAEFEGEKEFASIVSRLVVGLGELGVDRMVHVGRTTDDRWEWRVLW